MTDDTTRRIELSRGKIVKVLAICMVFIAVAARFAMADDRVFLRNAIMSNPQVGHALGFFGVAFGVIGVLYAVRKLFDRRPGLVLSTDGLVDNSSAVAAGFLPWSDVTGFTTWQFRGQRMLVIRVDDTQKYIRRANRVTQALHRANVSLCGSPIVISANALDIAFDELEPLLRSYHARRADVAT